MINHPIDPVYDKKSKILILGSFPSVKSREIMFFYGHKQNRFWQVVSRIFEASLPETVEEKREFLLKNNIAVWDVISSCEIQGSSDSSINSVTVNDISIILETADIKNIYVNGKTAEKYYNKYIKNKIGREAIYLPSTSAANASMSVDSLIDEWRKIKNN